MEAARGDAGLTNREVVQRLAKPFEADDTDTQLALLDPDIELVEWPDAPDRRTFRGHAGAIEAASSWNEVWERLRNETDEIVEAGDRVLVSGRTRGKGRGSSVEVEIETFNVYTVRDGKVTRIEFFTSREPAIRAAGLQSEEAR